MSRRQDDDLDELVSDLSSTLSDLQDVLADERRDHHRENRRPPSPSRLLQFTEEYTIPTLISFLETNIRALELLQGLLRLVNGRDIPERDRRVQKTGRRTLSALDSVLSDVQGALEGEPTDSDARALLDDARSLREEIDTRLSGRDTSRRQSADRETGTTDTINRDSETSIKIDVTDRTDDTENDGASEEVSVDDELETIKREMQDTEDTDTDDQGNEG